MSIDRLLEKIMLKIGGVPETGKAVDFIESDGIADWDRAASNFTKGYLYWLKCLVGTGSELSGGLSLRVGEFNV